MEASNRWAAAVLRRLAQRAKKFKVLLPEVSAFGSGYNFS